MAETVSAVIGIATATEITVTSAFLEGHRRLGLGGQAGGMRYTHVPVITSVGPRKWCL